MQITCNKKFIYLIPSYGLINILGREFQSPQVHNSLKDTRWNLEFGIWKFLPSRFLFFLEVRRANQLITRKGHLNNSPSRLNPWD
jgi:hypothetical protein